eukprot:TRINITY_DN11559_c0_g1_i1.p2 TRINITY_DN11559_c0_g1~~TRINITY_DN11559_c0_g1_i1.p2  ORF type:complete len:100 (-),score=0.60 TRINITY_DN11559_c0_g1_i1:410-709(-)
MEGERRVKKKKERKKRGGGKVFWFRVKAIRVKAIRVKAIETDYLRQRPIYSAKDLIRFISWSDQIKQHNRKNVRDAVTRGRGSITHTNLSPHFFFFFWV